MAYGSHQLVIHSIHLYEEVMFDPTSKVNWPKAREHAKNRGTFLTYIFLISSYEKYIKELDSDELEWGHLHEEKFWRENYKRFKYLFRKT